MEQDNIVSKFRIQKLARSSAMYQCALFVLILAGATIYFKPAIFGSTKALRPMPPEPIKTAESGQPAKIPGPESIHPQKEQRHRKTIEKAAELIAELVQKKQDINALMGYYRAGINDLEEQIMRAAQEKKIVSYKKAVADKQVELTLRTIQRRRHYIRKLEISNAWIQNGTEELLYLYRKAQIARELIDIADGIDLAEHLHRLQAAIQEYRPTAENLAVVLQNIVQPSLETAWSRLVIPKAKAAQKPQGTVEDKILISKVQEKLAEADLHTFHKKISARLPRYRQLIKATAEKHGFDWHLIAAQIYQESHLNPLAESSVGAKGLMQILPGTARSLGVKDIYDAVENINAGVKHLKTLYDHYESIAGIDRMMMALAAYNAGRGHVEDARRLAVKKNLDPDLWSSLTQTLPLLKIRKYYEQSKYGYCRGTEPVTYTKRIMTFYSILKQQGVDAASAQVMR